MRFRVEGIPDAGSPPQITFAIELDAGSSPALRIAFAELVSWMHQDYGLSELDSYELLSKVARIHLDEMVDPNYVVVAVIDKKYLPARKASGKSQ